MDYIYDDGGRELSGYKGYVGDCVVRSISIATGKPYKEVYKSLFNLNKENNKCNKDNSPRNGNTSMETIKQYLSKIGWKWVPTMGIGTGCKVHLNKTELPSDRIIVRVSKHLAAVINGILHDTYDCSRNGTRCVYGYFIEDK